MVTLKNLPTSCFRYYLDEYSKKIQIPKMKLSNNRCEFARYEFSIIKYLEEFEKNGRFL